MNKEILELIENNSKLTVDEISTFLKLSIDEVIFEISEMEKNHIICGYDTIINWDKVSDEKTTALIEVKVSPERGMGYDKIADRMYKFDEIDSLYLMSGGYDFMLLIHGKSMKEISKFVFEKLSVMDFITSTVTHFVMKKYKDHGVLLENPTFKQKRDNVIL